MSKVGAMMAFTKYLGNGNKVVTQTLNGKTMTTMTDEIGRVLRQRVKTITKQNVGNKKVNTITKLDTKYNAIVDSTASNLKFVTKSSVDRVYTNESKLLGKRIQQGELDYRNRPDMIYDPNKGIFPKISSELNYTSKTFITPNSNKTTYFSNIYGLRTGTNYFNIDGRYIGCLRFNSQTGLPEFSSRNPLNLNTLI